MKYSLTVLLLVSILTTNAQLTFSLNEYDKGELLGIKEDYCVLYDMHDGNSSIIDTVFDSFNNLYFEVLDSRQGDNFVKVRVVLSKWSNGVPDSLGRILLPKRIDNGKEGWVQRDKIQKRPLPERYLISIYQNHKDLLLTIAKNADWYMHNNEHEYPRYKSLHAQAYLELGQNYFKDKAISDAIHYLTKSISILPKKRSYVIRAFAKRDIEDFQGAISDCNKGMSLDTVMINISDYDKAYLNENDMLYDAVDFNALRGLCYLQTKDYSEAITDLSNAIERDTENGQLYYYMGLAKYNLGKKTDGCKDLSRAGELGVREAYDLIREYCN